MKRILAIGGEANGKMLEDRGNTFIYEYIEKKESCEEYLFNDHLTRPVQYEVEKYRKMLFRTPDKKFELYGYEKCSESDLMEMLINNYKIKKPLN